MPDCRPCSNLADDSSRWLHKYPAHLTRTWRLASGESFSLRFLDSTGYWTIERVLAESDVVPGLSARSSASQ